MKLPLPDPKSYQQEKINQIWHKISSRRSFLAEIIQKGEFYFHYAFLRL